MRTLLTMATLLVALLGAASAATAAEDDCVTAVATVCAFDEGSSLYNVNGVYRSDKWNTLASARAGGGDLGAAVWAGQSDHYDSYLYCNFGCTREYHQRDATGLNASQSGQATSGWVFVGQEEGFGYYSSGSTTRFWEYKTTGAHASRTVGEHRVDAGVQQTAWRGYTNTNPYATGCSTGAFARLDGKDVGAPLPGAPCDLGPVNTQLPQLYSECRTTPAGRVCGALPDWPDGYGAPFV